MKATGIVRRIDDLGRVVIPKEIRRTMRIREGEPLEIYVDNDGEVILKKYSPMGELSSFSKEYAEAMNQTIGHVVCISDRDVMIAVSGGMKKELMGKSVGDDIEQAMENRKPLTGNHHMLVKDQADGSIGDSIIAPIVSQGDPIGSVIICAKDNTSKLGEVEQKLAETAANFLAKQMEQ
ncbi:MAG: stage V sporulation protein T [Bacillota bacterium]|jgi:AbrB family transcriptional regulator (stage V sporulation protein T)